MVKAVKKGITVQTLVINIVRRVINFCLPIIVMVCPVHATLGYHHFTDALLVEAVFRSLLKKEYLDRGVENLPASA